MTPRAGIGHGVPRALHQNFDGQVLLAHAMGLSGWMMGAENKQGATMNADMPEEPPSTAWLPDAAVKKVTLPSWPKSAAWARLMPDGALEFELYDRDYLESERVDIWRVEARATGLLFAALAQRLGTSVDSAEDFLDALAQAFTSWTALKDWLLKGPWPVRHHVDPWP